MGRSINRISRVVTPPTTFEIFLSDLLISRNCKKTTRPISRVEAGGGRSRGEDGRGKDGRGRRTIAKPVSRGRGPRLPAHFLDGYEERRRKGFASRNVYGSWLGCFPGGLQVDCRRLNDPKTRNVQTRSDVRMQRHSPAVHLQSPGTQKTPLLQTSSTASRTNERGETHCWHVHRCPVHRRPAHRCPAHRRPAVPFIGVPPTSRRICGGLNAEKIFGKFEIFFSTQNGMKFFPFPTSLHVLFQMFIIREYVKFDNSHLS